MRNRLCTGGDSGRDFELVSARGKTVAFLLIYGRPNRAKQMVYLSIAAVGVGPLFQSPYIAIAACLPINEVATATSAIGLVRSLGGTSGISISGAMYASVLKSNLRGVGGYSLASDSTAAGDVRGLVDIQVSLRRITHAARHPR